MYIHVFSPNDSVQFIIKIYEIESLCFTDGKYQITGQYIYEIKRSKNPETLQITECFDNPTWVN